jgi:hypothetical protein
MFEVANLADWMRDRLMEYIELCRLSYGRRIDFATWLELRSLHLPDGYV